MTRLQSSRLRVVCSWLSSIELDYTPWDFQYCAVERVRYAPIVSGVPDGLSERISEAGGPVMWLRSIEQHVLGIDAHRESSVAPMICFGTLALQRKCIDRIRVEEDHRRSIREMSGDLYVRCPVTQILETCASINKSLWSMGCQVIVYSGDLLMLTRDDSRRVSILFDGCDRVKTPCLAYATENQEVLNQLRTCFLTEEKNLSEAVIDDEEIVIHPDWMYGAAKTAPRIEGDNTLRSLANWRAIQPIEPHELPFNRNQIAVEVDSAEEICEVQAGDIWIGEIVSALDTGSCFGNESNLITSYHVTYTNNVNLTRAGMNYCWDKVFHSSSDEELIIYGERMYNKIILFKFINT